MISNFGYGGMSGYTVYKTDEQGAVSVDKPEVKAAPAVNFTSGAAKNNSTIHDTYEPSARTQNRDNSLDRDELKGIRRILEEISAKLSSDSTPKPSYVPDQAPAKTQNKIQRDVAPSLVHPLLRNDIPVYGQHFDLQKSMNYNPMSPTQPDGSYNVLSACKNLNKWARTEYAQTEGFDTVYSPQELRDRISILGEIENHINNVGGPAVAPMQGATPYNERYMNDYKAMKKDPDRITRRTYFEATV
jgi:hypothetical protein